MEAGRLDDDFRHLRGELEQAERRLQVRTGQLSTLEKEMICIGDRLRHAHRWEHFPGEAADLRGLVAGMKKLSQREQKLEQVEEMLLHDEAIGMRLRQESLEVSRDKELQERQLQKVASRRGEVDVGKLDIASQKKVLEASERELAQLRSVVVERRRRRDTFQGRNAVLVQVQAALREDLQESKARLFAESELQRERQERQAGEGPARQPLPVRMRELEEVMVALKAVGVSLGSDYHFVTACVEEIASRDEDLGIRGLWHMTQAWEYLRRFASDALGPQSLAVRWKDYLRPDAAYGWPPVPPDAVMLAVRIVLCEQVKLH